MASQPRARKPHYDPPQAGDRFFGAAVGGLVKLGVGVAGARLLEVRGRKSGQPRRVVVNPITVDGVRYLVGPRGHAQWVRNLRAAGECTVILGRRHEHLHAQELSDAAKEPVLRAYLRKFGWEVGRFFAGVNARASSERLAEIAPDHPVFRLAP